MEKTRQNLELRSESWGTNSLGRRALRGVFLACGGTDATMAQGSRGEVTGAAETGAGGRLAGPGGGRGAGSPRGFSRKRRDATASRSHQHAAHPLKTGTQVPCRRKNYEEVRRVLLTCEHWQADSRSEYQNPAPTRRFRCSSPNSGARCAHRTVVWSLRGVRWCITSRTSNELRLQDRICRLPCYPPQYEGWLDYAFTPKLTWLLCGVRSARYCTRQRKLRTSARHYVLRGSSATAMAPILASTCLILV